MYPSPVESLPRRAASINLSFSPLAIKCSATFVRNSLSFHAAGTSCPSTAKLFAISDDLVFDWFHFGNKENEQKVNEIGMCIPKLTGNQLFEPFASENNAITWGLAPISTIVLIDTGREMNKSPSAASIIASDLSKSKWRCAFIIETSFSYPNL